MPDTNFRKICLFIVRFLLILPVLSACSLTSNTVSLHDDLGSYLQAGFNAQVEAAAHWDQLILGTGKNCQQGLPVPTQFDLTQSEAEQYPQARQVRDYLYTAITLLEQSSQIWDQICASPDAVVQPADVNRGYLAARDAKTALEQAQNAYNAWNS